MRFLPFLLVVSIIAIPASAEPPDLVTDRPDQTESTETVPHGWFQAELGVGDEDLGEMLGTGLLRIGLADRVELRVGLDEGADRNDYSLGAKMKLADEQGARPAIAVIVAVNEMGEDSGVRPTFRFNFANTLTDRLSLAYNAGVAWDETSGTGHLTSRFEWTAALGISATDRTGFFVEAFGDAGLSDRGRSETAIDGGVTYLVRPNVQLDLFAGAGVSDAAPDWFAGAGISFRLPR